MVNKSLPRSASSWAARQRNMREGFTATFADIDLVHQISWVQGFLSAFNYYVSKSGNVLSGIDNNGIFAWIDNYCAAHPLDDIATATFAFIAELSKRGGQ